MRAAFISIETQPLHKYPLGDVLLFALAAATSLYFRFGSFILCGKTCFPLLFIKFNDFSDANRIGESEREKKWNIC